MTTLNRNLKLFAVLNSIIFFLFFIVKVQAQTFTINNTTFQGNYNGSLTHSSRSVGPVTSTASLSQYGGWLDVRIDNGTGHFRTVQYNGSWYMVDPEGYLYFGAGVNSVNAQNTYTGINLPEDLKNRHGLNLIANWSDHQSINAGTDKIPYVFRAETSGGSGILFMQGYKNDNSVVNPNNQRTKDLWDNYIMPVFDPEFVTWADHVADTYIEPLKNDPYCIGVFSDNEIQIYDNFFAGQGFLLDRFLGIPNRMDISGNLGTNDPNYLAAHNWMITRHGGNTNYTISAQDRDDFHGFLASTYYRICHNAIKTYAPNMLYLGSRLHSKAKEFPAIYRDSAPYVDIFSVNYYGPFEPDTALLEMWEAESSKPFMITEFYAKADDTVDENGNPIDNSGGLGAGYKVDTQQDRALYYENFLIHLLESKGCVSYNWFKFQDHSTNSVGNDFNAGLIGYDDSWYIELENSFYNINRDIYNLREYLRNIILNSNETELIPTHDTFISDRTGSTDETNTSYGTDGYMDVRIVRNSSSVPDFDQIAYLKFDLSTLPANISSAVLKFNARRYNGNEVMAVYEFANDSWLESESYNTFLGGTNGSSGFGTFGNQLATVSVESNDYLNFEVNITSYVQQERNGDGILSLALALDDDDGAAINNGRRVRLTSTNGATASLPGPTLLVQTTLSNKAFLVKDFSIYPNPVKEKLTVKSPNSNIESIRVVSIDGREVIRLIPNKQNVEINTGALNSGIYIIQIQDETGVISSKKIIRN